MKNDILKFIFFTWNYREVEAEGIFRDSGICLPAL